MEISKNTWSWYIKQQSAVRQAASSKMVEFLEKENGITFIDALGDATGVAQWVAYKQVPRGDKYAKVPINPSTGRYASTTDSSTWGTLTQAQQAVSRYNADGIGFVLTNGYFGIDLDDVIDPQTGSIREFAREIIDTMQSYTEISPSGRGIHIIAKGSPHLPSSVNGNIEMYSGGRFFTITGQVFGEAMPVAERTEQAQIVWGRFVQGKPALSFDVVNAKNDLAIGRSAIGTVDYAYALATKYGEAAATLACEMYDETAAAQGMRLPPAEPAETASYQEVAKAVRGTLNNMQSTVPATVGRLVKQAGADTTLQNARRDGAEFAWIPMGDTCAFCLTLASRGWQNQRKKNHAEHIHANCDCEYAVRFDGKSGVQGYNPERLKEKYYSFDGTPNEKINAWRRDIYAENREEINAQKRAAYARRREQEEG